MMQQVNFNAAPCLLVCKDLTKPIGETNQRIIEILSEASKVSPSAIVREGLFVLAVASVETMLCDVIRYYLRQFPQKIRKKEFTVEKDDLLNWPWQLVDDQVDEEIKRVSYQNIKSLLDYFRDTLSLSTQVPMEILEKLVEIKESRNLLLHNNLVVNATYVSRAGPAARTIERGKKLRIDTDYLNGSLACLAALCLWAETEVSNKYVSYTKCAAIKRLWEFLFHSPVMLFENYWNVDTERDRIHSYKGSAYEDQKLLSNSELMFLGIWRAHFHGYPRNIDNFSMYSLDGHYQAKMLYFLSVLGEFRLE